jgi:2-amino-4-hydroxy-6-hydroxymethyldihydropteridine diphosphokinase
MTNAQLPVRRCFVALGANIGDAIAQVKAAAHAISRLDGISNYVCSSLYRSAPREISAPQPDYINAVAGFDSALAANELWRRLSSIELQLGRVRNGQRNAARTIDVDLLLLGNEVVETSLLTVPHPRMTERAFVLAPLVEIAPHVIIPARGRARTWLDRVRDQRIERLESAPLCN